MSCYLHSLTSTLKLLVYCYQGNVGLAHYQVVQRIMCYFHGIADLILSDYGGDLKLTGYSEDDWGSDPNESRST